MDLRTSTSERRIAFVAPLLALAALVFAGCSSAAALQPGGESQCIAEDPFTSITPPIADASTLAFSLGWSCASASSHFALLCVPVDTGGGTAVTATTVRCTCYAEGTELRSFNVPTFASAPTQEMTVANQGCDWALTAP